MKIVKTPLFIQHLFPSILWNKKNTDQPTLYLTFDDGPIPEVTPWVLNQLKTYNAKATFFCVGENINKCPNIFNQIIEEGHTIGNHTYSHLNGWNTNTINYIDNVHQFDDMHSKFKIQNSKLFRPPYGKLTLQQFKILKKQYQLVLWDVISRDFDNAISTKECLNNIVKHSKDGSIIVFHDSLKAEENLRYVLPKVLKYYSDKGYAFNVL